ncbi:ORF35 [White spot syndrome virus]|uniref:Wsv010 n=3 Tax=White spot syndrome virus TaxID=342409 RepID=Q77JA5_WSSVS|nr:wsv010 [Shrimp white spot syndrome virus]YP_009220480.1 envelope protein [White spot syndrome virus]AYW76494.1 envelope protein [Procambarus clarkii virus]AAK77704.1 ORF35 [White spot syndrome virus]AAL33014.1 wsv010 [Shrimp white spot syndrome virus]AAL88934.1 WSSV066 [Shrimp white spot syndrome virus]AFX59387.1 wsv010 [White spot syndrome virus]
MDILEDIYKSAITLVLQSPEFVNDVKQEASQVVEGLIPSIREAVFRRLLEEERKKHEDEVGDVEDKRQAVIDKANTMITTMAAEYLESVDILEEFGF